MSLDTSLLTTRSYTPLITPAVWSVTGPDEDRALLHCAVPQDDDDIDLMPVSREPRQWPRIFPGL